MKIHVVKKGDTLFEIAKKHGVGLEQLIEANPQIADPNRIDVGTKVRIPSVPKPVPQPPVEFKHKHTVSQGDTMWKLAKAWEVPLKAMIDANPHIKNPNVLLTGDTVYVPKINAEGHMMPMSKAELTAPSGKANTAPIQQAPGKAPTQPVVEAPAAPEMVEAAPEEKAAEKPMEQAAEKSAEKPVEKPAEKQAEQTEKLNPAPAAPAAEKPAAPANENPAAPIAEKPSVSAIENPTAPIAQKPPFSNPLPVLQGMQEAKKPELPPLAAPFQSNPAPMYEASKDHAAAPFAVASKEGAKPLCPPLPEFQNPYSGYPQIPVYPFGGAVQGQELQHPFAQQPIPAVEAMAYGDPGWMQPPAQDMYQPGPYGWPQQTAPFAPVMNPCGGLFAPAAAPMPAPWGEPDCGCGGMPNLPYAWAPAAHPVPPVNEPPMVQGLQAAPAMPYPSSPNQAPFMQAPYQASFLPQGFGYPGAGGMPYAAMHQAPMPQGAMLPQPYMQDGMYGFPGYQDAPAPAPAPAPVQAAPGQAYIHPYPGSAAAQPLTTYSTPYADSPYAIPGMEPNTAPHAGGGKDGGPGRSGSEETREAGKPAKKDAAARTSAKPKAARSPLQSFIERQRGRHDQEEPRDSRPWINL